MSYDIVFFIWRVKGMKRIKGMKKVLAVFISCVFTFSVVFSDFAYASNVSVKNNMESFAGSDLEKPSVLGSFGKLTSSENFGGKTLVLNIQDFHMHSEVQKNISALLQILEQNYDIKRVFVEGAYDRVSTQWLSSIENDNLKETILSELVNSGDITGVEYYSAVNNKKDFIYGLEDKSIHQANISRFAKLITNRPMYANALNTMQNDLEFMQNKYFNYKNKKFESIIKKHKKGNIDNAKFYKILANYLNRNSNQSYGEFGTLIPLTLNDYPNISLFLEIDKVQKTINTKKAVKNLQEIIAYLKENMSFNNYRKLLADTNELQDSDKLLYFIATMPEDFKKEYISRDLSQSIAVANYLKQINPVKLITEERLLIEQIRISLSMNKQEVEISFLSDMFNYFSEYMNASISADDHEYFQSKFDKFRNLWSKYSYYDQMNSLQEDFDLLKEYYQVNDNRNEIFIENISKYEKIEKGKNDIPLINQSFEQLLSGKENIIVCVTGGYHSKGLADLLSSNKVSHAIITPSVFGDIEGVLAKYENLAIEQSAIFSQTLALSLASQASGAERMNLLISSARQSLKEVDFNDDNISDLISYLNEALGSQTDETMPTFEYDKDQKNINMIDKRGKQVFASVDRDQDGKISIDMKSFNRIDISQPTDIISSDQLQDYFKTFFEIFNITSFEFGKNIFIPSIYDNFKNIMAYAAKHNIALSGDGLIFDIAGQFYPNDTIDGIETRIIGRMPDFMQKALLESEIRKKAIEDQSEWKKLLFALDLFNEFIPIKYDSEKMIEYMQTNSLDPAVINDLIIELNNLRNKEELPSLSRPTASFGTAGVRGTLGKEFNFADVLKITQAIAEVVKSEYKGEGKPIVLVGYDTRFLSKEFAEIAAGVFAANGIIAELSNRNTPTPAISDTMRRAEGRYFTATNITASHNPAQYGGYKVSMVDGGQANTELTSKVEKKIREIEDGKIKVSFINLDKGLKNGSIIMKDDIKENYIKAFTQRIRELFGLNTAEAMTELKEKAKDFYVIADAKNGTATDYFNDLFEYFGFTNNEMLNPEFDVTFDGKHPEPKAENLQDLINIIKERGNTLPDGTRLLGVSTDVDSDRFAVVDKNGRFLSPNEILLILEWYILSQQRDASGTIVRNLATTHAMDDLARILSDGKVGSTEVKVGFKWIAEELAKKDQNVIIAGESSGGVAIGDWTLDKDGFLADMATILICTMQGKDPGEILDEIYETIGWTPSFSETSVNFGKLFEADEANLKKREFTEWARTANGEEVAQLLDMSKLGTNARITAVEQIGEGPSFEGIKIRITNDDMPANADRMWMTLRLSGTEPLVRIYAESDNPERTAYLAQEGDIIVKGGFKNIKDGFDSIAQTKADAARIVEMDLLSQETTDALVEKVIGLKNGIIPSMEGKITDKFGTAGIRGTLGTEGKKSFKVEDVIKAAQATALAVREIHEQNGYSGKPAMLVGYDTRFLSREFAEITAGTLAANGIEVYLSDVNVPTPAIAYSVLYAKNDDGSKRFSAAVNITASHNPGDNNGYKFSMEDGGQALPEVTNRVERHIRNIENKIASGMTTEEVINFSTLQEGLNNGTIKFQENIREDYIESFLPRVMDFLGIKTDAQKEEFKKKATEMSVVVDAKFGTGSSYYKAILERMGFFDNEILGDGHDVSFEGVKPEPAKATLTKLIDRVKSLFTSKTKILGFSTDVDGDRFAIIDENGEFIHPNQILLILEWYILGQRTDGAIVRSLATTHAMDYLAKLRNVESVESYVGFKFIAELIHQFEDKGSTVLMGGESSGGLAIGDWVFDKDGFLANMLMLGIITNTGKSPSELLKEIYAEIGYTPYFIEDAVKFVEVVKEEKNIPKDKKLTAEETVEINNAANDKKQAFIDWAFNADIADVSRLLDLEAMGFGEGARVTGVSKIGEELSNFEGIKIRITNDAIENDANDTIKDKLWVVMRMSGTEPLVRIYAETDSEERTSELSKAGIEIVKGGFSSINTTNEISVSGKATIEDIDIQPGQKFIVRVDYNVPMENGQITDDTRIRTTLDTIKYITDRGGKVVLMAHFGRPKGQVVADMSLEPVANHLSSLLGKEVKFLRDAIGENNSAEIDAMDNGDIALLENVRFYAEEEANDTVFAEKLAANVGKDAIFVMDAFGAAHRAHASTTGISEFVSRSVSGLLMSKELQFLGRELEQPQSPSVAIVGGSKVKDKIGVISSLLEKMDTVIIGGAMAYSFLAAQGINIGNSLADDENIAMAKELLLKAEALNKSIVLPIDHKVIKAGTVDFDNFTLKEGNDLQNTSNVSIEEGYMGADIGDKTVEMYAGIISKAKTVLWNGPMGIFEVDELSGGTTSIAEAMGQATEENGAITIVGGGDSVAAVNKAGLADKMSHVSTGGGASLEFLEKGTLPAVEIIDNIVQTNSMLELENTWNNIKNSRWVGILGKMIKDPLRLRSIAVAIYEGVKYPFTMIFNPKKFAAMHFADIEKAKPADIMAKTNAAKQLSSATITAFTASVALATLSFLTISNPIALGIITFAALIATPFINITLHSNNNLEVLRKMEKEVSEYIESERKENTEKYNQFINQFSADYGVGAESIPSFIVNNPEITDSITDEDFKNNIIKILSAYSSKMSAIGESEQEKLTETKEWKALEEHYKKIKKITMKEMFENDPERAEKFTKKAAGIEIDYSKNIIGKTEDEETMKLLMDLAKMSEVKESVEKIMSGETWNWTEVRSVLHTALRNVSGDPIYVNGKDIMPEIKAVLEKVKDFSNKVRNGEWKGTTGKEVKTIISVGIGGSDLGPRMVTDTLSAYKDNIDVRFVSNVDPAAFNDAIAGLDPETTLVIVQSKTFTTQETMQNANLLKTFMLSSLKDKPEVIKASVEFAKENKRKELNEAEYRQWEEAFESDTDMQNEALEAYIVSKHFVAVSTNKEKVSAFGIDTENMFEFWDFVGGRFSLWSAIGLPVACAVGFDNFYQMLEGANEMDKHFAEAEYEENIPIIMAMLWIWYINFFEFDNHAVIAYSERMKLFTKYLQQLIMESLGKRADKFGNIIEDYDTGAAVFGEAGTDSQHSFFQQIHMGTGIIPVDFIIFLKSPFLKEVEKLGNEELKRKTEESYQMLIANYLAQMQALAFGRDDAEVRAKIEKSKEEVKNAWKDAGRSDAEIEAEMDRLDRLVAQKQFDGNRPSTAILVDELTPKNLGSLIALYEHITLVQSIVWRINAFDQWGVELGKENAGKLLPAIKGTTESVDADGSTQQLLERFTNASESTEEGHAIMQNNYPRIYQWLMSGDSPLIATLKLAITEAGFSIFKPGTFVEMHSDKKDQRAARNFAAFAIRSAGLGALTALLAVISPISLTSTVAGVFIGIVVIGLFPNLARHIYIDYKYVKSISDDIRKYVPVMSDISLEDSDYLEAIVLNNMPENPAQYGFKNTGLKADGKIIWASKKTGRLIIFSQNEDFNNITMAANDAIPVILDKKGTDFQISAIAVDEREAFTKNLSYLDNGILVIKKSFYDQILKLSGNDIVLAGERIRKEQEAEQYAFAKNFIMDLSFIESADELMKAISAYNKSGNQQIAVPLSLFEGKSDAVIREVISKMSENGTRVFAVVDKNSKIGDLDFNDLQTGLLNFGFSGYVIKEGENIESFRDYFSDSESKVAQIQGFRNSNELIDQIDESDKDSVKMINVRDYLNLLEVGERDISSKIENLVGLFGEKVLKFFNRTITSDSATKTVLEFDMKDIPNINENEFRQIQELMNQPASEKTNNALMDYLNISNLSQPNIFYQRIIENVEKENQVEVINTFLKTIAKKAKVKSDLYKNNPLGLEDKNLERLMVLSALSNVSPDHNLIAKFEEAFYINSSGVSKRDGYISEYGDTVTLKEFATLEPNDIRNKVQAGTNNELIIGSAASVYAGTKILATEMNIRENKVAAATIYELILAYGEIRKEIKAEKTQNIDVAAVNRILTAA